MRLDPREIRWCGARFDPRLGQFLGDLPPDAFAALLTREDARRAEGLVVERRGGAASLLRRDAADRWSPAHRRLIRFDEIVLCGSDAALVRRGSDIELRATRDGRTLLRLPGVTRPRACAISPEGTRLALSTDRDITVYARRNASWTPESRWPEPAVETLSFVSAALLVGARYDGSLLTAWSPSDSTASAERAPLRPGPGLRCRADVDPAVAWLPNLTAHDEPPRVRREHGLWGTCDGASVFATDTAEFARFRSDARWATAVAARYGIGGLVAPRVTRTSWGAREAVWTSRVPRSLCERIIEFRAVEIGSTLYRIERERVHRAFPTPFAGCDANDVARDRHRVRDLARALLAPRAHVVRLATRP